MTCKRSSIGCVLVFAILGIATIILGLVLVPVFKRFIHHQIEASLPLRNGTKAYRNWLSPPVPVYFQIWVFHVTNPIEVVQEGAKPVLVQMGPYTYREKRQKVSVHYTANSTITYRENVWFYFDPSLSVGSDTQTFTTVNLPMITIASLLKYEYNFIKTLEKLVFDVTEEKLFLTLSVSQFLWGYEDSLLRNVRKILDKYHVPLPFDDKFGLFRKQNGSDTGLFRIYTGVDSVKCLANIASWNNLPSLKFWTSDNANKINGSDGTKYPPFVDTSKSLYLFSSQLCRSLEITYSHMYKLRGIDLARFTLPHRVLADVQHSPGNRGFCTPNTSCLPSGLLNASVCRNGAPLVYSLPHFLDADPDVSSRVTGLHPNRREHEVVIDIEPMTGMVLHLAKRLQINVYLENISHIRETTRIQKPVFLPVLWLNETAEVDGKSAKEFQREVQQPLEVLATIKYALPALGTITVIISLIVFLIKRRKPKADDTETTPIYTGPVH